MKLPISIAKKLIFLMKGDKIPLSNLKHSIITSMIDNGILKLQILGRSKNIVYLVNSKSLTDYLNNHFGIENLDKYVEGIQSIELTRGESINISSNSKLKSIRTFKGFLVNSYQPLICELNNLPITIQPVDGTFTFIYDFKKFIPASNVTIVGIENPENFRHIQKQRNLFENIIPLFVSRYPQNKDLISWLQSIPNNYLHFGDFDFAGLNIYFNEYKKYLKMRAMFFMPPEIEHLIATKGNRNNYNKQTLQFDLNKIDEDNITTLIRMIDKYKKGLEQEIFAK